MTAYFRSYFLGFDTFVAVTLLSKQLYQKAISWWFDSLE